MKHLGEVLFTADLISKFFVAFYDMETGILVMSSKRIALHYMSSWKFPCDLISALPLDTIIEAFGAASAPPRVQAGLAFIKMLQLVRLYRVFEFFHALDYSLSLGQGTLLVVRNTTYAFYATHWAACMFYQVAQVEGISPASWVGRNAPRFLGRPQYERYLLSLYFSVSAFTGLGDNALYASTVPEAAFMICYLFFNLFLGAYILGTVTMLVVKGDERSKLFRDRMYSLADFSKNNELPQSLYSAMQEHLEVTFQADTASDEQVLGIYPTAIRRKVLRHLYLQPVRSCYLFRGCKQRFLDALLTAARVELFMPGVQIMTEGDNVTELLILVSGEVAVSQHRVNVGAAYSTFAASGQGMAFDGSSHHTVASADGSNSGRRSISGGGIGVRTRFGLGGFFGVGKDSGKEGGKGGAGRSHSGGSVHRGSSSGPPAAAVDPSGRGSFVNGSNGGGLDYSSHNDVRGVGAALAEVPFFTDIPSHEAALSTTVVRALSLPKAAWEMLVEQFPQQARIVLDNLQARQESDLYTALHNAALVSQLSAEQLDTAIALIKAKDGMESVDPALVAETRAALTQAQMEALMRLDDVRAVVRAHVRKVDHLRVYRFLQQAAQGDVETLRAMLNQGMSANSADYDGRTGLMLAAAAGHESVVRLLLDHGAKADQLDSFGNSALSEACKEGNDKVIDLLLGYGAT
ncbi:hypothetical protein GPECTOR_68g396 [Gonium pectorale]|uniref:Cyclic nucleotide-binding domain-containing protein n=1 Tax=Gonium pectorale TaxID=33097 RepID=A0A150G3N3_GONPE|nr:hypothetical protein GPECTOR_68g396 [Gonium pectorale]|eukprot:KXZ44423.1 hypothetical protein GPECTOR_68g396 [Gonium pectorale]